MELVTQVVLLGVGMDDVEVLLLWRVGTDPGLTSCPKIRAFAAKPERGTRESLLTQPSKYDVSQNTLHRGDPNIRLQWGSEY